MAQNSLLYIGINGTVLALDRATGEEVWRTTLKSYEFVNVVFHDGEIFAAAKGELFCLDPGTGEIRWKNTLKGLGRGLISIATPGGQQTVLAQEKSTRDQAASSAATTAAVIG